MESEKTKEKKEWTPLKIKIQAITDLVAEIETVESICKKYSIHPCTVTRWKNKVNALQGDSHQKRERATEADRRKAVREIQVGLISVEEARVKYGVQARDTVLRWIKKYSSDLPAPIPKAMSEEDQDQLAAIRQHCKELETALSSAHLQIAGLETMIDVAEKELRIEIRKSLVPNSHDNAKGLSQNRNKETVQTVW